MESFNQVGLIKLVIVIVQPQSPDDKFPYNEMAGPYYYYGKNLPYTFTPQGGDTLW